MLRRAARAPQRSLFIFVSWFTFPAALVGLRRGGAFPPLAGNLPSHGPFWSQRDATNEPRAPGVCAAVPKIGAARLCLRQVPSPVAPLDYCSTRKRRTGIDGQKAPSGGRYDATRRNRSRWATFVPLGRVQRRAAPFWRAARLCSAKSVCGPSRVGVFTL